MTISSGLVLVKLATSLVVFLICLAGGLIPLKLVSNNNNSGGGKTKNSSVHKALSYGNCFGGGILLGVALVHLLVDSESSDDASSGSVAEVIVERAHRLPHLLAAVGFLLAFILERVLFSHSHDHSLEGVGGDHNRPIELHEIVEEEGDQLVHGSGSEEENKLDAMEEDSQQLSDHENNNPEEGHKHGHNHHSADGHLHHAEHHEHGHSHGGGHQDQAPPLPYLLYSVLALESFVTGSALGIQENESKVWVTFFAIATHIWAEAFTLTINLLKSKFSHKKVRWLMVLFSAITPGASFVGILLNRYLVSGLAVLFSQVLVAIAAGIFLYVAIIEIMVEEFHSQDNKWQKLSLLLLGFVFISLVGWMMG